MRSSSDSIAQLASALAKAQIELVNPAKTLTAVIGRWGNGGEGQSYSYAPLSAGLEIVRQTLCKHELAVIQTTHVDRDSAMVLLTTTLAHSSGEWVCGAWPVCRTADMSNPKMMGAALTYARRYGLFTLVGIAGEDDLDGPNLDRPETSPAAERLLSEQPSPAEAATPAGPGMKGPEVERLKTPPDSPKHRRKRSDAGISRGPRPRAGTSAGRLEELAKVEDTDGLFRWALAMLPVRTGMDETARAELDAAFLGRAEAVGADRELLSAFHSGPGLLLGDQRDAAQASL